MIQKDKIKVEVEVEVQWSYDPPEEGGPFTPASAGELCVESIRLVLPRGTFHLPDRWWLSSSFEQQVEQALLAKLKEEKETQDANRS